MKMYQLFESEELTRNTIKKIVDSEFFNINFKNIFEKYLDSDIESNKTITSLKNDLYKNGLLFRGEDEKQSKNIRNIRKNRIPRDTMPLAHHHVNNFSDIKFRNFPMSYKRSQRAGQFGNYVYTLYPLDDNYQLYFHPKVIDFTNYYGLSHVTSSKFVEKFTSYLEKYFSKTLDYYKVDADDIKPSEFTDLDLRLLGIKTYKDIKFYIKNALQSYMDFTDASKEINRKIINDVTQYGYEKFISMLDNMASHYTEGMKTVKKVSEINGDKEILIDSAKIAFINHDDFNRFIKESLKILKSKK